MHIHSDTACKPFSIRRDAKRQYALAKRVLEANPTESELLEAEVAAKTRLDDVEKSHKVLQSERISIGHHMEKIEQTMNKLKDEMIAAQYKGPSIKDLEKLNMKLTMGRNERAEEVAAENLVGDGILNGQSGALMDARREANAGHVAASAGFAKSTI